MPSATQRASDAAREIDHGADQRAARRIAIDVAGEAHVELQDVGPEIEDVAQAE
jgi:hypothetical protein